MRPGWLLGSRLGAAAIAAALVIGCRAAPPAPALSASAPAAPALVAAPAGPVSHPEIGFRSGDRLLEHYRKHGAEFGARSPAEYLREAQALRDRPPGGAVLELRRRDGVVTRFDRDTGAFLAFNPDLTIRTFFKPTDGVAYFQRQARREPERS